MHLEIDFKSVQDAVSAELAAGLIREAEIKPSDVSWSTWAAELQRRANEVDNASWETWRKFMQQRELFYEQYEKFLAAKRLARSSTRQPK